MSAELETDQKKQTDDERKEVVEKAINALQPPRLVEHRATLAPSTKNPPWASNQFFDDKNKLQEELAIRFDSMPVMSIFKKRGLGKDKSRGVATLYTQDGAANVLFQADANTKVLSLSFSFGSMLTLSFTLDSLTHANRDHWLTEMRRPEEEVAFLWGPALWERDSLIGVSRKYHTNLYAFSVHNFQAAVRLTPDVMEKLLNWLDGFWQHDDEPEADDSDPLLSW